MITQLVNGLSKVRVRVGRFFQPADYSELINRGRYYLASGRPDLAEGEFASAVGKEPNNPDAWYFYGCSLLGHDKMEFYRQDLDEMVWWAHDGRTYKDEVKRAYEKVAELSPSAENYFDATILAIGLRELKVAKAYLASAIEFQPDDYLLIKIGRVTTTLRLDDLTERVKALLGQRELAVHLYPIR